MQSADHFDDIFSIPVDFALSSCMQELSIFKGPDQRLKVHDNSMVLENPCEQSVRRCRSDSTNSAGASHGVPATSQDDCVEAVRWISSMDTRLPSNRALHNFRVGLLTHQDSKVRRSLQDRSNSGLDRNSLDTLASSSCPSQDALWDLLLQ